MCITYIRTHTYVHYKTHIQQIHSLTCATYIHAYQSYIQQINKNNIPTNIHSTDDLHTKHTYIS